jgi:hypothetical protein
MVWVNGARETVDSGVDVDATASSARDRAHDAHTTMEAQRARGRGSDSGSRRHAATAWAHRCNACVGAVDGVAHDVRELLREQEVRSLAHQRQSVVAEQRQRCTTGGQCVHTVYAKDKGNTQRPTVRRCIYGQNTGDDRHRTPWIDVHDLQRVVVTKARYRHDTDLPSQARW